MRAMSDFANHVQKYHKAIEQEFDLAESGDVEAVIELARKKIAANLLIFTNELIGLARAASSESTQLSAIKTAFSLVMSDKSKDKDVFEDLLKQLTNNDGPS